ncbi:MAG: DUF5752 family protein [Candidatus Omnitrophota bacterium]
MPEALRAKEAFRFYTRLHLPELTGLRATTLNQLLDVIKQVPDSCIYYHTHRFLQQHLYFSPEPPNDFAYWVSGVLGEDELSEQLASIDVVQYSTIRALRENIIIVITEYLENNPLAKLKFAREGEEFYFMKSVSFIMPTGQSAYSLREFVELLKIITFDSLYFHIFEARLRLEKSTNDFSNWIENSFGNKELAEEISKLDPYTYTLDDLRKTLIRLVERRIYD